MVGGGSRRQDGPLVINNTNVFAALETLRKKKKSDKDRASSGKSSSKTRQQQPQKEPEPQVIWAPAPLTGKSWADIDDDDDYYATTSPPQPVLGSSELSQSLEDHNSNVEDSVSEEEILDVDDDDLEEDHDHEPEVQVHSEPMLEKPPEVPPPLKEAERQLSKKERKKKELAELEALLADFGVGMKESNGRDESHDAKQEKKDGEYKQNPVGESKSAKKKKKKDKSKEGKESHNQPTSAAAGANGPDEVVGTEQTKEDASAIDMKERLKKTASMKKKKSSKEMDAAARAAAQEAAARSARLAAAKKKEKNHYNQQPVR